ncbi:MAG TPA: helix-turn-helix transcriptional regulator [Vicinamibacterales bacterium]
MPPVALPRTSQADLSFGRQLRRERERRKIPLASIAENSKISAGLFEDLERDDVSRWPSGIFRRSFIRAYAKGIGLDPDEIAREFLERFPDPNDPTVVPLSVLGVPPSAAGLPSPSSTGAPRTAKCTALPEPPVQTVTHVHPLSLPERCTAVAWDAGIVITLGLLLYTTFGSLWMPLCVAMTIYFAGSIFLFGNTPGASLCSPAMPAIRLRRSSPSSSDESSSSTENDPSHRTDGRSAHPYQAPGT